MVESKQKTASGSTYWVVLIAIALSLGGAFAAAYGTGGVIRGAVSIASGAPMGNVSTVASRVGDPVRGEYLAEIFACKECHTLRAEGSDLLDQKLTFGGGIPFEGPWGMVRSANVSRVARRMPTEVLEATIRGRVVTKFQMPTDLYAGMAREDMRDLIAYLQSIPVVERAPNENALDLAYLAPPPLPARSDIAERAPPGPSVARGEYLTRMSICKDCHSPRGATGYDEKHLFAGGGLAFRNSAGRLRIPPNLTPDVATGLGSWSDDAIVRLIRTGVRPDQSIVSPFMPYGVAFARMNEEDVRSIVAFLRSIPPIKHAIPRNAPWPEGGELADCCFVPPQFPYADPFSAQSLLGVARPLMVGAQR